MRFAKQLLLSLQGITQLRGLDDENKGSVEQSIDDMREKNTLSVRGWKGEEGKKE